MTYETSDAINIFANTDNNYAVPAYITFYSLIHNYRGKSPVNIYFLIPGDMSEKNRSFLLSLSDSNPLFEIFIIDMKDAYSKVNMNMNFTCTVLYRLMIPRIVEQMHKKIDKCIYLDVDTVVEGDISELYKMDSEWDEYYFAGVKDPLLFENIHLDHNEKLGIPSLDKYINGGVLLINLKQINASGLRDKLEEAGYRDDYIFHDQDVINAVCYEGIKMLPLRFNVMPQVFFFSNSELYGKYGKKEVTEARKKPVVIHYIGDTKSWSYRRHYLAGKWWKYVKMQDETTMREYIAPFIESHKKPLSLYAIELTLINFLIRIRLIGPIRKIKQMIVNHKKEK